MVPGTRYQKDAGDEDQGRRGRKSRLKAIALRSEAVALRLEIITLRLEAIALNLGWMPLLLGWRPWPIIY